MALIVVSAGPNKKAAPALPTEEGWYATHYGSNVFALFDKQWAEHSSRSAWVRDPEAEERA